MSQENVEIVRPVAPKPRSRGAVGVAQSPSAPGSEPAVVGPLLASQPVRLGAGNWPRHRWSMSGVVRTTAGRGAKLSGTATGPYRARGDIRPRTACSGTTTCRTTTPSLPGCASAAWSCYRASTSTWTSASGQGLPRWRDTGRAMSRERGCGSTRRDEGTTRRSWRCSGFGDMTWKPVHLDFGAVWTVRDGRLLRLVVYPSAETPSKP